jgi:hypothetical protein
MQAVVQVTGSNQSGQNKTQTQPTQGGGGGGNEQQVTINLSKVSGDLDIDGMTISTTTPSQFPTGTQFTITG